MYIKLPSIFLCGLVTCQVFGQRATEQQRPDSSQLLAPLEQKWNIHAQTTVTVQGDLPFRAKYSGPNSLNNHGEMQETATFDLFAGARLWKGAEIHSDLLVWQGYGLSKTFGIAAFPNGDAYKAGTATPNFMFARLFFRQTFSFGGKKESVTDDPLTLAGNESSSRLIFTIGRFTPLDVCDNNRFAHDPHTQFLNWAMMGNITWDYGQNTVGYTTGLAIELDQPTWSLRSGFFRMPSVKNGFTGDDQVLTWPRQGAFGPFLKSWAMMVEAEKSYAIHGRNGIVRFLYWLDEADFASYEVAANILLSNPPDPNSQAGAGVTVPPESRAYRTKYGFGVNLEQELTKEVGLFARLGWTPGKVETWTFSDAQRSASIGTRISGKLWKRDGDALGLASVVSGVSSDMQRFLKVGGTDMLSGDGNLNYGMESVVEAYYDFRILRVVHATVDYQYITNPAFNLDRGPVSIFAIRFHWEF